MSTKRTRGPKGGSVRLSVYVPVGVAERLAAVAEENNESLSGIATRILEENMDGFRMMSALDKILANQDMLLFSMEILAARQDELTRLIALRVPSRTNLTEAEKQEMRLTAQKLTQTMSRNAADAAMAYRTGESAIDPLNIDRAMKKYEETVERNKTDQDKK